MPHTLPEYKQPVSKPVNKNHHSNDLYRVALAGILNASLNNSNLLGQWPDTTNAKTPYSIRTHMIQPSDHIENTPDLVPVHLILSELSLPDLVEHHRIFEIF